MSRHHKDWLAAYLDYASFTEAPRRMHFFSGAVAIAGALRRKVWIEQYAFQWYPNLFVLLVAPPAVVSKSTTADLAIKLLRKVPGIKFGPDAITWQALVTSFANATESFQLPSGEWMNMSAVTSCATELGNLLDPRDRQLTTNLITLYDSRELFEKVTKGSGNDTVQNAWFNLIACTTPSWIQENVPDGMIGGGLFSRILSVYAEKKERLVPWPADAVPPGLAERAQALVDDLTHIATLAGPFTVSSGAKEWNAAWYAQQYNGGSSVADDRFGGYISRKQTHICKLSMIISVAQRDDLVISAEDMATACQMVTDLEPEMAKVFRLVGRTPETTSSDRFIEYIRRRQLVSYEEAYRYLHAFFADPKQIEGVMLAAVRAGYIEHKQEAGRIVAFSWKHPVPENGSILVPK